MSRPNPWLFLLFASLSARAAIFGADERMPVTPKSSFAGQGRATAVAVLSSLIEPSKTQMGTFHLLTDTLDGLLCPDERFAADPSLSYACSGFLVAPDLIVTAGHCMVNTGESKNEEHLYCDAYGWLFDYAADENGRVRTDGIPADNFYKCKKIIYAVKDEQAPFRDYALVQLERPVSGRKPFPIAAGAIKANELFSMIGHPFGTPQKVSPYARVTLDNPARPSFLTTLDAFEGNSGSVVFNTRNEAVGILVGGTPSYNTVKDIAKGCERYNRCDELGNRCTQPDKDTSVFPGYQGVGSEVQRIAPIQELLDSLK